jgi:hypothetical protein
MLGVNKPIRMAIIPPETCASSSSVSSRVFSVSFVLLMIFSIQASADNPIAGAATLAQRSRRHCERVHRRHHRIRHFVMAITGASPFYATLGQPSTDWGRR